MMMMMMMMDAFVSERHCDKYSASWVFGCFETSFLHIRASRVGPILFICNVVLGNI
jgi:hypothetical protein